MLDFAPRPPGCAATLPVPGWAGVATCGLPATDLTGPRPAPHRLADHLLMLTTAGHGTVEIDFTPYACRPGTLLWGRPGQAVRFGGQPGLDAAIVVFDRDLHPADDRPGTDPQGSFGLDESFGPTRWQLAGEDEDAVINEYTQLSVDCQRHRSGDLAAALLRHQLAVLLLRIALLGQDRPAAPPSSEHRTFIRFRRELELGHPDSRRVEDYAATLGCSVRTLTRACLAITGRTAKQVVDDRVALEARRLLACTSLSVAEVGRQLGFPEPTNFGRFFHREVGRSPGAFRAAVGHGASAQIPTQRQLAHSQ